MTTLSGVTLPCVKLVQTRAFYTELLGLKLVKQTRNHVVLDAAGIRMVLIDAHRVPGFSKPEGQALYLELAVADLATTRRRLARHKTRMFQPRQLPADRLLTVEDPEGNLINLVQRRK